MCEFKKTGKLVGKVYMLIISAIFAAFGASAVSAHDGHHHGEGLLVEIFHWFTEPDHLLVVLVVALAVYMASRAMSHMKG